MSEGTVNSIDNLPERISHTSDFLRIEHEFLQKYEFTKMNFHGDLDGVLRGKIKAENIRGGKIGLEFESIFDQLRKQVIEYKTSIVCTSSSELLLQVNPSWGDEETVRNIFAITPEGVRKMEIHNHPMKETGIKDQKTFAYFSSGDLADFAYSEEDKVAEAVVFKEGTAILLKTEAGRKQILRMKDSTGRGRQWAWTGLSPVVEKEWTKNVPNDSNKERLDFSKSFAKAHGMRLLFIPVGQQDIQVLV